MYAIRSYYAWHIGRIKLRTAREVEIMQIVTYVELKCWLNNFSDYENTIPLAHYSLQAIMIVCGKLSIQMSFV